MPPTEPEERALAVDRRLLVVAHELDLREAGRAQLPLELPLRREAPPVDPLERREEAVEPVPVEVRLVEGDDREPPTAEALIDRAKAIGADGLDLSATAEVLTPEYAQAIKAAGLGLYVWTVNDINLARAMVALGVEGITTDRPGWLREQLGK